MATVIEKVKREMCTGCGACKNICPKNAIELVENHEGFYNPYIDMEKCMSCGLCEKHCPVLHAEYVNDSEPMCYAVWADDEIREVSSSGGAFSILADYFFEKNGGVCGAVYNEDFSVRHMLINRKDDIEKMRGSKYIQSYVGNVYREIKAMLEEGNRVLFTGMPCQIAGLYGYLGHDYKRLYTAELVCHGITSYKVFNKYKEDILLDKEIRKLDFKKKKPWGWHAGVNAEFVDGTAYRKPAEEDSYFQAYLNGISKNMSCENCKFNRMPRQADLTIGDFWKISEFDKQLNDNKGTSLVLVNSEKGKELINKIIGKFKKCVEVPLSYAIRGNGSLVHSYKTHFRRNKFFRELKEIEFNKLVSHCKNDKFDIGIVGLWYGLNYGSILTYYALYSVVNQLGYDAIMVNKPEFIWSSRYVNPETIANRFIKKYCNVSNLHKYNEYKLLNDHCDSFIVGSDVVWNYEICGKEAGNFFFLDFVDDTKKKIAYASSFGGSYNAPERDRCMNQKFINKFDGVSVREDNGINICRDMFGVKAEKVLDPVFLCDFSKFDDLTKRVPLKMDESFLMSYILGGNTTKRTIIQDVAQIIEVKKYATIVNPNSVESCKQKLGMEIVEEPSVEEWLWYMKNCKFFIGDSFHGLCFALIFRKPFLIIIDKGMPSKDRFLTLLTLCGLEDKLIYIEDYQKEECLKRVVKHIDYDEVYRRLATYKEKSINWLSEKLEQEKVVNPIEIEKKSESDLYFLAKIAAENSHGRKIITWGNNLEFKEILMTEFGLNVAFGVVKNQKLVDNREVFPFDVIENKSKEYYLVIPDVTYKVHEAEVIEKHGFKEGLDYVYRYHKPVTITNEDYRNKKYFDLYGNVIEGDMRPGIKVNMRGFNNIVRIGENVKVGHSVLIEMNGNTYAEIGEECNFTGELKIIFRGEESNRNSSRILIGNRCQFSNGIITLWKCPNTTNDETKIVINKGCTFGENLCFSANSGKKIVIGEDCMFSYNVSLQAGDGHAIFDVFSGERENALGVRDVERDVIALDEHVWVGKNCLLLTGTNVGKGTIIGAGSVVKGSFANNCIIGGNPAKEIKQNKAWSRDNSLLYEEKKYMNKTTKSKPPIVGKKVLVIGGTKFMGIKLVEELIKYGNDVTIANRGRRKDNFRNNVERVIMDVSDAKSVEEALSGKYYDVVFDNLAYCSCYVKNVLSVIKCGRYIQLSSVEAYLDTRLDLDEKDYNPYSIQQKWCETDVGYQEGKRQAEAAVYQRFPDVSAVTVRIPYVTPTDRLLYYCRHIVNQRAMNIDDINRGFTFIRDAEVGKFLPWIAAQDYEGPINLASTGQVTIKMILEYIEKKVGKKAIIDTEKGDESPFHVFNEKNFSMNMNRASELGYKTSNLDDWFWDLLDVYIEKAMDKK